GTREAGQRGSRGEAERQGERVRALHAFLRGPDRFAFSRPHGPLPRGITGPARGRGVPEPRRAGGEKRPREAPAEPRASEVAGEAERDERRLVLALLDDGDAD